MAKRVRQRVERRYDLIMRTADFDFDLPPELIAQTPIEPRDAARLMVIRRSTMTVEDRVFRDIADILAPGDLLVVNDTRVLRARLHGRLADTGGAVEALLLRRLDDERWEALVRPGRRIRPGRALLFGDSVEAAVESTGEDGARILCFPTGFNPEQLGETPLPPYIHASLADGERYQTVYSHVPGSAAAPTAGLHFTPSLLERVQKAGIGLATVTLHIGPGTFRPVSVDDPRQHPMHEERYWLDATACEQINATKQAGHRVVAVGTTAVRVLEQAGLDSADGVIRPSEGATRLLILPGYQFRVVDALITNFHLPRSTLLMLVSAFAGHDLALRAYREAVERRYRFYSFGDAMLLL